MRTAWRIFRRSDKAAHLVEYALLVGVVGAGAIAILTDLRVAIVSVFEPVINTLGAGLP
jgi:Flp pilus assembly pilin Flp